MKKLRPLIPMLISGLLLAGPAWGVSPPRSSDASAGSNSAAARADFGNRATLFEQSAARVLSKEQRRGVSYLLLDAQSGKVLASNWADIEQPIPFGSLLKPFVALAYGERHNFIFPVHICRGTASGCWLPSGHGKSDIETAIANSCNSYFRVLAANMTGEDMRPTAQSYGLNLPDANLSGPELFGLGNDWLVSPLRMAQAYLELNRRRSQPGVREVLAGMAGSGLVGTGLEVDRAMKHDRALVKTGTALCTHKEHSPGDGFVVALLPEEEPQILLLVRVHGVPGAKAAAVAGRMLKSLGD